jgi:hypothetical protein
MFEIDRDPAALGAGSPDRAAATPLPRAHDMGERTPLLER